MSDSFDCTARAALLFFMQDCSSSSSDINVMSCDHNSNVFDEGSCDIDVVDMSTPDDNSTDDTDHSESEHVQRTIRSKRRKQLLAARPEAVEYSEVSLYSCDLVRSTCHLFVVYTYTSHAL